MKKINVSAGKENFSQRNNAIKPLESCNVTSMVMALSYLGAEFPKGDYPQPEDNLRQYIEKHGKNPENHYDLSAGVNNWIGRNVTNFSTARKVRDMLNELRNGRPVVVSGTFPGHPTAKTKPLGHIVCLVGMEWDNDNPADDVHPDRMIWDDPYGNTMKDWQGSGNDIIVPWDLFVRWLKPTGDANTKWGHFFTV